MGHDNSYWNGLFPCYELFKESTFVLKLGYEYENLIILSINNNNNNNFIFDQAEMFGPGVLSYT